MRLDDRAGRTRFRIFLFKIIEAETAPGRRRHRRRRRHRVCLTTVPPSMMRMNVKEDRHHLNRIPTTTGTIPADLFIPQIRFLGTTTPSKRRTPPHPTTTTGSMTPDAGSVCNARSGGSIPIIPRDRKVANLRQRGGAPTLKLARGPVTPQAPRGRPCPLGREDIVVVWFRGTAGFPMVFRGKRPFALFLAPFPSFIGERDYLLLAAGGGFVGVSSVGDAEMAREDHVVWHVSGFFVVSWTGL
jgi:hypothetical protein